MWEKSQCDCAICRSERLGILPEFETKEKSMINSEITKQEAIKLLDDKLWGDGIGIDNATKWIEIWENLGIIKFKEIKTVAEKLLDNPELAYKREKFRQALSDLGYPGAATHSHWALEAFDKAWELR